MAENHWKTIVIDTAVILFFSLVMWLCHGRCPECNLYHFTREELHSIQLKEDKAVELLNTEDDSVLFRYGKRSVDSMSSCSMCGYVATLFIYTPGSPPSYEYALLAEKDSTGKFSADIVFDSLRLNILQPVKEWTTSDNQIISNVIVSDYQYRGSDRISCFAFRPNVGVIAVCKGRKEDRKNWYFESSGISDLTSGQQSSFANHLPQDTVDAVPDRGHDKAESR